MTNLGAILTMKIVHAIRFKSKNLKIHVSVISIALISYTNTALLQFFNF